MNERTMFPCPRCELHYPQLEELYTHVLINHATSDLVAVLGANMDQTVRKLTKADFIQVDSQWIFVIGAFHLSLMQNKDGEFMLMVYGAFEPLPAATQYPTEPEWDRALDLANKFMAPYSVAVRDQGAER